MLADAAQVEQVIDHPHERLQGRGIRVDERDAPQVQVHRAGNVAVREILGRTKVDDQRRRGTRLERVARSAGVVRRSGLA